ncbi:MAG: HAMP domain-containing histidine kinase [Blautia sp.]|nr:HAMP domain-containing histidine kinase [Blautia sp.]
MIIMIPLCLFTAVLFGIGRTQSSRQQTADTHFVMPVQDPADPGGGQPQGSDQDLSEGENADYDLTIDGSDIGMSRINLMGRDVVIAVVVILIITALSIGLWLYQSIAAPVQKLKAATQNIKEGNLDFVLEIEGNDEFADLCRDFEEMRLRLKESAEEKLLMDRENKELISNISHDLRTPITSVKGYVEGIMDGVADTPEKMERYVRTIYNKTIEMDHLINELTFYSKIDTNRIPYAFSKLNVQDYFSDCVQELSLELETKRTGLRYTNDVAENVMIIADGEQLRRVIQNIVGNSLKYMDKENGLIWIRVKDVGDFVQVEIEDNGKGISQKNLQYIFDRFYRTDASRNSLKGGSGIGLSIVKKIIEDHGGKVWATSKEGEGTTLYFVIRKYQEIPVTPPDPEKEKGRGRKKEQEKKWTGF